MLSSNKLISPEYRVSAISAATGSGSLNVIVCIADGYVVDFIAVMIMKEEEEEE